MAEHSIAEAAAVLGVSVDTVRRRIKRGELQARPGKGGALLVDLQDLDAGGTLEASPASCGGVPASTTPSSSGDLALLEAELEHTRDLLAEVQRSRGSLQATVEALTRQLEAAQQAQQKDAEERRELRLLLANAQQQLGRLLPAPSNAQQGTPEAPRRWWWPWGRA